jgi:hypothetical protein
MATVKNNKSDKEQVEKSVPNRLVGKIKPKPKNTDSDNKFESGGDVDKIIPCRLITYDVWGNNEDGFWIHQTFRTETIIDLIKGMKNERIVEVLREKGVLTDKATKENLKIDGDIDSVIFFIDLEKGLPLCELQNIDEFEKKANGADVVASELLIQDYFKTTAPIQGAENSSLNPLSNENNAVNDTQLLNTSGVLATGGILTEGVVGSEAPLPDYDTTQESLVRTHMSGNEIFEGHLEQILGRKTKYEEVIGGLKLRRCFLREYYKII